MYIGQSVRIVQERFRRHINDAVNGKLNTHFARAIRKYGADNFVIEVLDTAETQEELNHLEQHYIKKFNSVKNGYNETDALYKSGGNTYQNKSVEEMSLIKEKIAKTKIGDLNPNSRKIKCLNIKTNLELHFNTVKECQEYFGEQHHRFITTRANRQTRSLFKNEWTIAYEEDEYKFEIKVRRQQTVCEITNNLKNEVYRCGSVREIQDKTGLSRHMVSKKLRENNGCFNINEFTIKKINQGVSTNG